MTSHMNPGRIWRWIWASVAALLALGAGAATRFELDGSFGLPVFTQPATGAIRATPLADGGVLVEGDFAQANGQMARSIWRLDAQGAVLNVGFGAGRPGQTGTNGGYLSKAVQLRDGRVLVAQASAPGSAVTPARLNVARVALSGEVDAAYSLDCVAYDNASALVTGLYLLPDGRVIVTGSFASVGGHTTRDVARLTATGEVDPDFTSTTPLRSPLAVSAGGTLAGLAVPAPGTTGVGSLVRFGADGTVAETWTLPTEPLLNSLLVSIDANERVLVAINRIAAIYTATAGGKGNAAPTYWPGPIANGFTIYRYRTGVAAAEVFYTSPEPAQDSNGMIVLASGWSVSAMNAAPDGGLVLRGTMPAAYAGQPNGLLKLRGDGTVDTTLEGVGLSGLQVTDLQALADGWLATGQLTSLLSTGGQVRKLDAAFARRGDFVANLRQVAQVESALTLPDGSVLVRGLFSGPADAVQRYVRVTADGTVDFAHVPPGPSSPWQNGVASLGQDGKIYLGGWPRGAQIATVQVNELAQAGATIIAPTTIQDNAVERYSAAGVHDDAFGRRVLAATQLTGVWADATGRVLLGGYDAPATGAKVAKLARLLASGANDATFAAQLPALTDGQVRSVAGLPGGAGYGVLVGEPARMIALDLQGKRLGTGGGVDINYPVNGATTLITTGGATYMIGAFTAVLGVTSPGIVRLGADGLPDASWRSGLGASSAPSDVQALADGRLLVSGFLGQTDGYGTCAILNADGSLDPNERLPPATAAAQLGDGSLLTFLPDGTTQRWRPVARASVAVTGAAPVYHPGETVTLTADLPAGAGTVTWRHDGTVIPGATTAVLTIPAATVADEGIYTVSWTAGGVTTGQAVRVTVQATGARIINASARSPVGEGDAVQITGFVAAGTSTRPVLVRSVRGALAQFGVAHPAAGQGWDVFIDGRPTYASPYAGYPVYKGTEPVEETVLRSGAFGLPDLLQNSQAQFTLQPGKGYTLMIAAPAAQAGVALSELYVPLEGDGAASGVRLMNFALRGMSGAGEDILIAGFVVAGDRPLRVLITGRGPDLVRYGVSGAITDPAITLYRGATAIATNDDWETQADPAAVAAAARRVGAGELSAGARDAALLVELAPGAYTVLLDPKATPRRVGMIELFDAGE